MNFDRAVLCEVDALIVTKEIDEAWEKAAYATQQAAKSAWKVADAWLRVVYAATIAEENMK